jgi:hypothetical protein
MPPLPYDPTNPVLGLEGNLFGEGLPSSALLYNAMRQAGIGFDPSNPRIARLMRQAPALAQAFAIQQAMNPGLGMESMLDTGIKDFYMNAVGGGARGQIAAAMRMLPEAIQTARALAQNQGGELTANPWMQQFMAAATDYEDAQKIREELMSPFMTPTQMQAFQRGGALANLGVYNRAETEGISPLDIAFGRLPGVTPRDEAALTGGGGTRPSAATDPNAFLNGIAPPQGLQLNPVTPPSPITGQPSAQSPWLQLEGQARAAGVPNPGLTPADMAALDEILGESEQQKQRKLQQAKGVASGRVTGGGTASGRMY